MKSQARRVLVSGASIAGPTVGYWLGRYGFDVDVVEQAASVRGGGYAIDIRGSAIGVIEKMGILPQIRAQGLEDRTMSLFDREGDLLLKTEADRVMSSATGFDVEIARGDLSCLLYEKSLEQGCRYRFNDRIASLEQDASKVHVRFASGSSADYDYVIAADGMHSGTRKLAFGDESQFLRNMGYCYVAFSMPRTFSIDNESLMLATVGKMAGLTHYPYSERVHGIFAIADETIPVSALWDPQRRAEILQANFGDYGWHVPEMLKYQKLADDVFADTISQTHMTSWSKGRVALTGDAAHAPGFITGQGTSLALASAYVLAGELAMQPDDPEAAFAAYEREARPFADANQAVVTKNGWPTVPANEEMERMRNERLRTVGIPKATVDARQELYKSLRLKDYDVAASSGQAREQHELS